jgi:hypothetical protein
MDLGDCHLPFRKEKGVKEFTFVETCGARNGTRLRR